MCSCVGCLCESIWMNGFGKCSKTSPTRASTVEYSLKRIAKVLLYRTNIIVTPRMAWCRCAIDSICLYWNIESSYSLCANEMKPQNDYCLLSFAPKNIIFQMQNRSPHDKSVISIFIKISSEIFKFNFVWRWIQKKK